MIIPLFFERTSNVAKRVCDQNAYFSNIFVLAKGIPFAVTIQGPDTFVSKATMLADKDQLLTNFAPSYKKMHNNLPVPL